MIVSFFAQLASSCGCKQTQVCSKQEVSPCPTVPGTDTMYHAHAAGLEHQGAYACTKIGLKCREDIKHVGVDDALVWGLCSTASSEFHRELDGQKMGSPTCATFWRSACSSCLATPAETLPHCCLAAGRLPADAESAACSVAEARLTPTYCCCCCCCCCWCCCAATGSCCAGSCRALGHLFPPAVSQQTTNNLLCNWQ
jgi:hypothetical protein